MHVKAPLLLTGTGNSLCLQPPNSSLWLSPSGARSFFIFALSSAVYICCSICLLFCFSLLPTCSGPCLCLALTWSSAARAPPGDKSREFPTEQLRWVVVTASDHWICSRRAVPVSVTPSGCLGQPGLYLPAALARTWAA